MSNITKKTPVQPETADALLSWLDAFPTTALERRLGTLLLQRRELDVEIRFLQAQLFRYRQYLEDLRPGSTQESPAAGGRVGGKPYPAKRLAVLRLLSESPGRALRLSDIRSALVHRGWLEDSDKARHALQVALLGMAKRGELEKPRTGFYRMATDGGITETDEPGEPLDRDSVPGESEGGAA
jgi:hypothetical protein